MKILGLTTVMVAALLTGCLNDDCKDDNNEVLGITDFYIVGTNENARDETADINPYEDSGVFEIFANISKPDSGFYLNLYTNGEESLRNATQLYSLECTSNDDFCYLPDYYAIGCAIETDLTGACLGQSFDLTSALPQIPFSGFLILEVCHRVQKRCFIESKTVIFR